MKRTLITMIAFIALSYTSFAQVNSNKKTDEGKIEGNIYTSNEIGWVIEIPKNWTIVDVESSKAVNEKGAKAIEEAFDGDIDFSGLKNLISLKKDLFNSFQSTSEPFELEYEGEWEENNIALKDIIFTTYQSQGLKADSSITQTETIDGVVFQTYTFTLYNPKGEVILQQIMYSSLINGFDFGVNINYNNDKDRDELLRAFRSSKFRKN